MSKKQINTKVLSGFVELLPKEQILFDNIKNIVEKSYKSAGYVAIDTPVIEKSEVLFAKAGGDTEKQVYRFTKGDNDLSLRFDLTVPFARYVSEHYNDLVFPFKRYHIAKVYRGERAQKGRYREFYQADIDIVSEDSLSVMYDVDVISTLAKTIENLSNLCSLGNFKMRISNRKIWDGFFEEFSISGEQKASIMNIIDKKAKITAEVFDTELSERVKNPNIEKLIKELFELEFIPNVGVSIPEKYHSDFAFINDNEKMKQGIRELEVVMKSLETISKDRFVIDLSIVRGLDYYTGTVFETFLENYPEFGSVSSGGRYENLCDNYTDKKICGVGGSIGLSRLFIPLIESGAISENNISKNMIDVLVLPQGENCYFYAFEIKNKILNETIYQTSIIYENKKFKKLMEYANKVGAKYVVIIGEDEVANNTVSVKNMITGEQQTVSINDALKIIKEKI
ncbi:MAG: histidine--tRNA ligase [Alphaproteobacteria bacterium]|nr:histidine--tRNA ligase [Alphaproteobacteria bacterium]